MSGISRAPEPLVVEWFRRRPDGSYLVAVTMRTPSGAMRGEVMRARNKNHLLRCLAQMRATVASAARA